MSSQSMRALEWANAVRVARARLRREVAAGRCSAADVILDPPVEAMTVTISELLVWQRGWGWTRARRFLAGLAGLREEMVFVSEGRVLRDLTRRERSVIVEQLPEGSGVPFCRAA